MNDDLLWQKVLRAQSAAAQLQKEWRDEANRANQTGDYSAFRDPSYTQRMQDEIAEFMRFSMQWQHTALHGS